MPKTVYPVHFSYSQLYTSLVCAGQWVFRGVVFSACSVTSLAAMAQSPYNSSVVELGQSTIVAALQEMSDGMVQGIAASRTETGTGTDTNIEEVPQSISVVGSQEMKKIGATDLKQALSYTAGVAPEAAKDKTSERVYIRGFDSNGETLTNGRKQKANLWDGTTETYSLERVEVLKGPATILYGAGSPGGVVNQVTKKAQFDDAAEIQISGGMPSYNQIAADVNKVVTDDMALRAVAVYRKADTTTKGVPDNRSYFNVSGKYIMSDESELDARLEYQKDESAYPWGLPAKGTLLKSKWGSLAQDTYIGNPEKDTYAKNQYSGSIDFNHYLTDNLTLKQGMSYFVTDVDFNYMLTNGKNKDERMYEIGRIERKDSSKTLATSSKLIYEWDWLNTQNTTLLGLDFSDINYTTVGLQSASVSEEKFKQYINVYKPDYSNIGKFSMASAVWSTDNNIRTMGVLLQNQTKVAEKVVATYGVRHDKLEATTDFINMRQASTLYQDLTTNLDIGNTSVRAGAVYLGDNGVSPYISYSESFQPSLYTSEEGLLKPVMGKLAEVGVRYKPQETDTLLTASVYKVTEENSPVPKPGTVFYKQIPKIDAVGVELEAKTQLGDEANLIASYTYNNAKITDIGDLDFFDKGNPKPYTPKHMASAFVTTGLGVFDLPDLQLGLGARYVGEATTNYEQMRSSYMLGDAFARYDSEDWSLALNVNNILNNMYIDKCTTNCFYGPSRKIKGTLTRHW